MGLFDSAEEQARKAKLKQLEDKRVAFARALSAQGFAPERMLFAQTDNGAFFVRYEICPDRQSECPFRARNTVPLLRIPEEGRFSRGLRDREHKMGADRISGEEGISFSFLCEKGYICICSRKEHRS